MDLLETSHQPDLSVLRPTSDLVAESMPQLRPQLRDALADAAAEVVIDLSSVQFMDSSGIGLLIAAHNTLKERSASLKVSGASPEIAELLTSMCLDRHFPIEQRSGES